MVHDLLHGQFSAAAHDNGLAIAGVAIGCIAWGNWTIRRWRGQQPPARPAWLSPANIAVMIVWTIVRNLPALGALRPLS